MNDPLRPSSSLDSTKRTPSLDDAKATTGAVQVVDNKEIERLRKVEKHSSVFTIVAAGAGLISDGIQNNLLTMTNGTRRRALTVKRRPSRSAPVADDALTSQSSLRSCMAKRTRPRTRRRSRTP